jgi:hypothetical protein
MKWEPWIIFRKDQTDEILPIAEPPCKHCKHWRPVRVFAQSGRFEGIAACRADDMHFDFSCYENNSVPELFK